MPRIGSPRQKTEIPEFTRGAEAEMQPRGDVINRHGIEPFINKEGLAAIEEIMAKECYLASPEIGWAFRMLRAKSHLAFDVLFWNTNDTSAAGDASLLPRLWASASSPKAEPDAVVPQVRICCVAIIDLLVSKKRHIGAPTSS